MTPTSHHAGVKKNTMHWVRNQPDFFLYTRRRRLSAFWKPQIEAALSEGHQCILCDVFNANDDAEWSRLGCGHHYHTDCITTFLKKRLERPYCPRCCEGDDASIDESDLLEEGA